MDIRKRKIKGILALSQILIYLVFILSAVFFLTNKTASALTTTSPTVKVGELLLDDYENEDEKTSKMIFDGDALSDLYEKITNINGATLSDLINIGDKDSSYFRQSNNGKDIIVELGGKQWTATYLTTDRYGNLVLDLWLSNYDGTKSLWNNNYDYNIETFPSNMYGISYMRSFVLNNGGKYWSSNTSLTSAAHNQDPTNQYAMFTMSKDAGVNTSITTFLIKPEDVDYQKDRKSVV